jgi:hypothetical protein
MIQASLMSLDGSEGGISWPTMKRLCLARHVTPIRFIAPAGAPLTAVAHTQERNHASYHSSRDDANVDLG